MNDLDELHEVRPVAGPPSDEVVAAARGELMAAIAEAGAPRSIPDHVHTAPTRRRRTFVAAAAAAVAVAAIATVTIVAGPHGAGGPEAAGAVQGLARVAAARPANSSGDVDYTKSEAFLQDTTVSAAGVASSSSVHDEREIWIAPDGSGRIRETRGTDTIDNRFGPGGLSYTSFAGWPTGPAAVLAKLQAQAGSSGSDVNAETFVVAGDALRETDAPPAVRAAIFGAITKIPGIEMLGTVRDQIGRAGVGVAIASGPERQVLIFDPGTSALLGEQSENRTTGSVDSWTVYLESSLVAAVPAGGTPLPSSPSRANDPRFGGGMPAPVVSRP